MNDEEVGSSKKKNEDNSEHARQDENKLRRQTEQLEKEMLSGNSWQMTGEAKGTSRRSC
jgi:U3 small nucleolar ribonucleoprotein component